MDHLHIRFVEMKDAEATLGIYRPFVQETAVSFEYEVPTLQDWKGRIAAYTRDCPWLVCGHLGAVVGYAYAAKHRSRMAYAWSAETTIYLADAFHGAGIARILYQTLFDLLRLQGYVNVLAGVTVPNAKSENFHRHMGFDEVGIYRKVGYKAGTWHDTRWFQLSLQEHDSSPVLPKPFTEIRDSAEANTILQAANAKLQAGRKNS